MNGTGRVDSSILSSSLPSPPLNSHAVTQASGFADRAVSASAAASASGIARLHRVARHQLEPSTATEPHTHAAPAAPYRTIPADAEMGIVAAYSSQEDKLRLRALSDALKREVDRQIETLTLNARDAISLFNDAQNLPCLKQLNLIDWNDQDLIDFATVLTTKAQTPFELVLIGQLRQPAPNLQCLLTLHLSALKLYDLRITPDTANRLAAAPYPIAIVAPPTGLMSLVDIDAMTQAPTLNVLSIGFSGLSNATAAALRTHPSLTDFACNRISGDQLRALMANAQIQSVRVGMIENETRMAFAALAQHPALTSLHLGAIDNAQDLLTLSGSTNITALHLGLKAPAISSLPHLANMPSLRALTLSGIFHADRTGTLSPSDIHALCCKPLAVLEFRFFAMRDENLLMAATAHANTLRFFSWPGTTDLVVHDQAIDALADNPYVSSLSVIGGHIVDDGATRIAALPRLEALTLERISSRETSETVQRAWTSAGKPLVDLKCTITPPGNSISVV